MSADDRFERELAAWMTERAAEAPSTDRLTAITDVTAQRRPRPAWLAGVGSDWTGPAAARPAWATPAVRRAVVVALLAALLMATAIGIAGLVGGQLLRTNPPPWPVDGLTYEVDGDIYVADPDGTNEVRIADGTEVDGYATDAPWYSNPHWSPDGRYLMYDEQSVEGAAVHVIDATGDPVVSLPGFYSMWRPDSAAIAVQDGRVIDIYDLDGILLGSMSNPGDPEPLTWTPDGNAVLLPVRGVAWLLPIDGTSAGPLGQEFHGHLPAFSPDGSTVAIDAEDGLYLANPDGSSQRLLSKPVEGTYYGPLWSPTGDRIAVMWSPGDRQHAVVVVDVATGRALPLDEPDDPTRWPLDWSPDGRSLLLGVTSRDPLAPLWVASADGSADRAVVARAAGGDWRRAAPLPLPSSGVLEPGTYSLPKHPGYVAGYERLIVTLPAGWSTRDGSIVKHPGEAGEVALSAWAVSQVYADPCHWRTSAMSPLEHSHDAAGAITLEDGLATQKLRGPIPRPVTDLVLGGIASARIELSVPPDLDLATCDEGEFRSWQEGSGGGRVNAHHAPGQLDAVYYVDLDRQPLLIDVSHMPGASAADLEEIEALLASLIIE